MSDILSEGLNTAVGIAFNNYNQKRQHRWANEAATTAYNRQVEQWKREAVYNSPKAQMARFVDAGLNPNLVYSGAGAIAAPSLPSVQSADNPTSTPAVKTNLDLINAEWVKTNIDALKTRVENETQRTQSDIELNDAKTKEALSNIGFNDAKIENLIYMNSLVQEQTVETINRANLLSAQARKEGLAVMMDSLSFKSRLDRQAAEASIEVQKARGFAEYFGLTMLNLRRDADLKLSSMKLNVSQAAMYADLADYYKTYAGLLNIETQVKGKYNSYLSTKFFSPGSGGSYTPLQLQGLQEANQYARGKNAYELGLMTNRLIQKYGDSDKIFGYIGIMGNVLNGAGANFNKSVEAFGKFF